MPWPEDIEAAHRAGFDEGVASHGRSNKQYEDMYLRAQADFRTLQQAITAFEREAGFELRSYSDATGNRAAEVGALVKAALEGDRRLAAGRDRLKRMAEELEREAQSMRRIAGGQ